MRIVRFHRNATANTTNLTLNNNYILPSISIKKVLDNKNNLRLSFSKTITRPVLIETMPIEYVNPKNTSILGNAEIQNSENYNIDLKWEYFPTNKEMFAVNLFAKRIDKAIERGLKSSASAGGIIFTFLNAKKADLASVELEGILSLGRLSRSLDKFTLGVNTTFMYANVERSDAQLELEKPEGFTTDQLQKRGLQGAAPYVINADLKYEYKNLRNFTKTFSLVYNVSGSKIITVGGAGLDHYYERPFHQLDFVHQNQLDKN